MRLSPLALCVLASLSLPVRAGTADDHQRIEALEAQVKALTAELQAMKATLEHLVHCCRGDDRPDCPIIVELGGGAAMPAG